MHDIKRSGGKPVIIIDEAENLKIPVIQLLKSIFDRVIDSCSIVLIGTPELIEKINKGCAKGISGMPQFLRRFKAGIRYLPVIDVSFDLMLDKYKLERGLLKLIRSLATNYGELRDYLEPVMREADLRNEKLTEDFFRMYHDIPKKEGFRS
jgi:type II secretory pathway predicted ATPase ExeA